MIENEFGLTLDEKLLSIRWKLNSSNLPRMNQKDSIHHEKESNLKQNIPPTRNV